MVGIAAFLNVLAGLIAMGSDVNLTRYSTGLGGIAIDVANPRDVRTLFQGLPGLPGSESRSFSVQDDSQSISFFCSALHSPASCRVVYSRTGWSAEDYVRPDQGSPSRRSIRLSGRIARKVFGNLQWLPVFKIVTPPAPQPAYGVQEKGFQTLDRIFFFKCAEASQSAQLTPVCDLVLQLKNRQATPRS